MYCFTENQIIKLLTWYNVFSICLKIDMESGNIVLFRIFFNNIVNRRDTKNYKCGNSFLNFI